MTEHDFLLRYRVPADIDPEMMVERLGERGCDDALVGTGMPGRLALDFVRLADTPGSAVSLALRDVREAIPDARLIEVEPDLVGLSYAADLVEVSRQNLHKLMRHYPDEAPSPVHEGSPSLWHLADLLEWLIERYEIPENLIELARVTKGINLLLGVRSLGPNASRGLEGMVPEARELV